VLLTRSPLRNEGASPLVRSLDLHVLSTPPAFILSQDQTLHRSVIPSEDGLSFGGFRNWVPALFYKRLAKPHRSETCAFGCVLAMQFSRHRQTESHGP
jgi:hypothetical protein